MLESEGGSTTKMATNFESGGSFTESMLRGTGGQVFTSTVILAVLGVLLLAMNRLGVLEENEPTLLKSRIPFCGHLLGMLKWQVGYFQMLRYLGVLG